MNIYERINVLLKTSAYIAFNMLYGDPLTHTYKRKENTHSTVPKNGKKMENFLISRMFKTRKSSHHSNYDEIFIKKNISYRALCTLYW